VTALATADVRVVTLVDLVRVVTSLKRYWLGGAALGLAAALAAGFLTRPVYRASAIVMPVAGKEIGNRAVAGLLSGLAGAGGLGLGDSSLRDEALAVLRSRQFAEQLITDEKLLPVFFAERWDQATGKWTERDPDRIPTNWDGWIYFDRNVRTVIEDQDRGLVTVRIEWFDPVDAARWTNLMVARANDELRSRKLRQLDLSLAFLQAELGKTQLVELRAAIAEVMESQINERMLASARPEYAFRIIDPAVPADLDQPQRPKKMLLAAVGTAAGALLGLILGIVLAYARNSRVRDSAG
jgi:hypothetical protein